MVDMANKETTPAAPALVHSFATSEDGTQLSYYTVGSGPHVLVLHGAASFALTHKELAFALSPHYTVHLASRRGRGLSGPYQSAITDVPPSSPSATGSSATPSTTVEINGKPFPRTYPPEFTSAVLSTDASDLHALLTVTGSEFLITVSSGALVALHYLLTHTSPSIRKVIIFEPPIFFTDRASSFDVAQLQRFESESAVGDEAGALVTAMRLVQLGPGWIPRWLMKALVERAAFPAEEKQVAKRRKRGGEEEGVSTMRGLGKMLRFDFAVVEGMIGMSDGLGSVVEAGVEVLLLAGGKSPEYLKEGMAALREVMPAAKSVVLPDVGHEVLCGRDMRGQPGKAVDTIAAFFS